MSLKRVVFIRPGETDWNKKGRWQGMVAIPLNTNGVEQAKRLAKFIRNIHLDMLYSSDLRRAKDTAVVLSEYANIPLQFDERLRERDMGLWQGLTTNEVRDWYKVDYEALVANPFNLRVPKGESRADVAERVHAFFEEIQDSDVETIGILSHTTAMRILLNQLVPEENPGDLIFRNMSVTTVIKNEDNIWRITQLDDVMHLEGMKSGSFKETIG